MSNLPYSSKEIRETNDIELLRIAYESLLKDYFNEVKMNTLTSLELELLKQNL